MAFHGKVLKYDDCKEFYDQLPSRTNFIDSEAHRNVVKLIKNRKPIRFLPNDIFEDHEKDDKSYSFKLKLIGILTDGTKAAVVINGIYPDFEIKVPNDISSFIFQKELIHVFNTNKLKYKEICEKKHYPFKGFQEKRSSYMLVTFDSLIQRRAALNYAVDNRFQYINQEGIEVSIKLETVNDDKSCYHRKVARIHKFKLCDWNVLKKYELDQSGIFFKKACIKVVFQVNVQDICDLNNYDGVFPDKIIKDLSMIAVWDIETDSTHPTGNAPEADKVFNAQGEEEDILRMDSTAFYWYTNTEPLVVVNITDMWTEARDDCMIIICENQVEIMKAKAVLMEKMCPEFYSGFNDGLYDWKFVLRRAEAYKNPDILKFMQEKMSVVVWKDNFKHKGLGVKSEHIKIDADTYTDNEFLLVPGFICIDTRTIFRQLYPSSEKSNLNFFLAANKLGSKEDMPYQTMFRIFRLIRELRKYFVEAKCFEDIRQFVKSKIEEYGENYKLIEFIRYVDDSIKENDLYAPYAFTLKEVLELVNLTTQVVHYCNVDAKQCQNLLRIRFVIPDRREVSNMAYTSMYDAFYRAGGVKVRNLVLSEACLEQWDLASSNISNNIKSSKKYPGAYVVPPKKGLYRDDRLIKNKRGDTNSNSDRPCAGLDFSSLYPSLIMTYNFSPEKVIFDDNYKEELDRKLDRWQHPYRFIWVEFLYGNEESKTTEKGWVVQHTPILENNEIIRYDGMGLYPYILKKLFDQRRSIKKQMAYYQDPKEFLDKAFEFKRIDDLAKLSLEEQYEIIVSVLDKEKFKKQEDYNKFKKVFYLEKIKSLEIIEKFLHKEVFDTSSDAKLKKNINYIYEDIVFMINYLNVKQNALKIFMNTFYGELGNSQSPFFIPLLAGGVTTYGIKNLKLVKSHSEQRGFDIKYGDSVTGDTPVLCRKNGKIFYIEIQDLCSIWERVKYGLYYKEHGDCLDTEVWSDLGWLPICKVIRHKVNKKIYRVSTPYGTVDVTEDHSLITKNYRPIKPKDIINSNHELLHAHFPYTDANYSVDDLSNYLDISTNALNLSSKLKTEYLMKYFDKHMDKLQSVNFSKLLLAKLYYMIKTSNYWDVYLVYENDDGFMAKIYIEPITNAVFDYGAFWKPVTNVITIKGSYLCAESQYVYDLNTGNSRFMAGVGQLVLKNTDSLYICPPNHCFEQIDAQYESGAISKIDYWSNMIEIAMEVLDKYKNEVGELLFKDNGTRFLSMAYEEILFPYALVGKKKYIGVAHVGIVNLRICLPECSLEEFIKSKSLFIRGLEIKKRGSSEFLKLICYEIIKEAFSIESIMTFKEIVESKLQTIPTKKWNNTLFKKSARYKLPGISVLTGERTQGNVSVLTFVRRMKSLKETHPEFSIKEPEIGERFNYIIVKKYPEAYDRRGRKRDISVGEKYEYFESLENEQYKDYLAKLHEPLEIDIDYYITNEVIGMFARFLIYHPEYDKFFNESMYEDDQAYKKADQQAHLYAMHTLQAYYKKNFATVYVSKGGIYKDLFKKTNAVYNEALYNRYGAASIVFNLTNALTTGSDQEQVESEINFADPHIKNKLKTKFIDVAKKTGEKYAISYAKNVVKRMNVNPFNVYRVYVTSEYSIFKSRSTYLDKRFKNQINMLNALLDEFIKICIHNNMELDQIIDEIKNEHNLNFLYMSPDKITVKLDDCVDIELLDKKFRSKFDIKDVQLMSVDEEYQQHEIVQKIYDIYQDICAIYKSKRELEKIKEDLEYLKAAEVGHHIAPPSLSKKKELDKQFLEWLDKHK